ncbi:hypothetical protein, partial [Bradyrhizobium sp.]|uniref:hypothetical protein n=1 Tax=Bradyrhizobium sp. TaxID=376 RepID=UPI002DF7C87B|nr:hypothetical protein [Bradyrhizobium sp.]
GLVLPADRHSPAPVAVAVASPARKATQLPQTAATAGLAHLELAAVEGRWPNPRMSLFRASSNRGLPGGGRRRELIGAKHLRVGHQGCECQHADEASVGHVRYIVSST